MYVEEGCLTEEEVSDTDSPDSPISPKVIKGRGSPRKIKSPVVVPRRNIQFHSQTKRISLAELNGQNVQIIGANQLDLQDALKRGSSQPKAVEKNYENLYNAVYALTETLSKRIIIEDEMQKGDRFSQQCASPRLKPAE